jgi:hypothetical protein
MTHELKTDAAVFQAVREGKKTYEIRKNDRNFRVGDELWLKETRYTGEEMQDKPLHNDRIPGKPLEYTGRMIAVTVTHILQGPIYGLMDGWCIMSIAR